MDKRRVRLEINGVVCGLITAESEEYMQALGGEVGDMMSNVLQASPFVTREAAALTAALSYCDDSKKREKELHDLRERCDELEVEAELWQEEKEKMLKAAPADDQKLAELSDALMKARAEKAEAEKKLAALPLRIQELEAENQALSQRPETAPPQTEALEELEKRLSALQAENEELARKTAELEADKEEFRRAAAKVVEEAKQVKLRAEQKVALAQEQVRIALEKGGEAPAAEEVEEGEPLSQNAPGRLHNPLRHDELDREGLVSFFEKKA